MTRRILKNEYEVMTKLRKRNHELEPMQVALIKKFNGACKELRKKPKTLSTFQELGVSLKVRNHLITDLEKL